MKLNPQKLLIICLSICSAFIGQAQTHDVKFDLFSGANGILLGKINNMTRDKNGAMWFSDQTNRCLTRYDGFHMTRYTHNSEDPNSLGGTYPECLLNDSLGNIWIGFFGMGLDKFDPDLNTFSHYRHDPNDPTSLANDTISALLIDHLGNFWVGTASGLDLLNRETGEFTHFQHNSNDSTSLSYNMVRCIYEDKQGTLWVGTGFPWKHNNNGGLNRFNRESGTFKRFMSDPDNPHTLINNKVRAIFEDSRGTFWIGTMGDGLHTMDRETGIITRHTYDPKKPETLSRPPVKDSYDHITFITEDPLGSLWIGTLSNGLERYDPETKRITHYTVSSNSSSGFKENSAWWAYCSPDGLFWISTQSSRLYRVELYTNYIPHQPSSVEVRSFAEESSDILWVGTVDGLIRKNKRTGNEEHFIHHPNDANSISDNMIFEILKDSQGTIWAATLNGLSRYNPQRNNFTNYYTSETDSTTMSSSTVLSMAEDREGRFWVGTNNGLNLMDRSSGKFKRYDYRFTDTTKISGNVIFNIIPDKNDDVLWLAIARTGDDINRFDPQTGNAKRYFNGETLINTIYQDSEGIVWAGTRDGLYRYSRESDDFQPFEEGKPELFLPGVNLFVEDNDQNLWMTVSSNLYKLNKDRNKLLLYSKESGIDQGEVEWKSGLKARDGKLYIGAATGYYSFYPNKLIVPPSDPEIYLSDVWVNGLPVKAGSSKILPEPINSLKKIRLASDQNIFSLDVALIDFQNTKTKKIYYKLNNYDESWRVLNDGTRINYFNIPVGNYTLNLKGVNPFNGKLDERTLAITISPPWWNTWWGYCILGIAFVAFVYAVHRFQRARVLRAEHERNREKELAQAKEVEKAYKELKETQNQLIQSEKMASLGELTAGIAHEIQNPLNFVNNFSDVNSELIQELQTALERNDREEVTEISKNIKENEDKIKFHGKRADGIVKGMLQHSRGSSDKKELTDINTLCDEYLRLSYHGLRAKDKTFNAKFESDFDQSLPEIPVVPQDIGRVILNLINNAFYSVSEKKTKGDLAGFKDPQGLKGGLYEPTVTVTTKNLGNKVEIRIKDNGNGIPENIKEKIFQPFFTTKPSGKGTGLGLSLAYEIITKGHNGDIRVESINKTETTFIITLPK